MNDSRQLTSERIDLAVLRSVELAAVVTHHERLGKRLVGQSIHLIGDFGDKCLVVSHHLRREAVGLAKVDAQPSPEPFGRGGMAMIWVMASFMVSAMGAGRRLNLRNFVRSMSVDFMDDNAVPCAGQDR